MIVLLFHRQRDNLTEHVQIKFHHSSLFWLEELSVLQLPPVSPIYKPTTRTLTLFYIISS